MSWNVFFLDLKSVMIFPKQEQKTVYRRCVLKPICKHCWNSMTYTCIVYTDTVHSVLSDCNAMMQCVLNDEISCCSNSV